MKGCNYESFKYFVNKNPFVKFMNWLMYVVLWFNRWKNQYGNVNFLILKSKFLPKSKNTRIKSKNIKQEQGLRFNQ